MARHVEERIKKLMRTRALVLDALQSQPNSAFRTSDPDNVTADEEKVVSTYVLALMVEDVAGAVDTLGPT